MNSSGGIMEPHDPPGPHSIYEVAVGSDLVGHVETRGIDHIPAAERHSSPRDLFWGLLCSQFCFAIVVFGSFPLTFGLGWWASVTSLTVGVAIGTCVLAPMSLIGPRTGTNQSVSSGAFFGANARLIGTAIALAVDLGFLAIIAWTTGQALVAGFHRLVGTPTGNGALTVGIVVACVGLILLGYLGHATIVSTFKATAAVCLILQVVMIAVFAGHFHVVPGGHYLFSFWATWVLAVTIGASLPISYATWPNDYGRYMRESTSARSLLLDTGLGIFLGCWIAVMVGAFLTACFRNPNTPFVDGLFQLSPTWFLIPLMIYGFTGNSVNGGLGVYNSVLDLHALLYFLRRSVVAVIVGAIVLILSYVAVIVFNAVDTIDAFIVTLIVIMTPWMTINIAGHFLRHGRYHWVDLYAFEWKRKGGLYWFTGGVNFRAVGALVIGSTVGLMFEANSVFSGPLSSSVGGVDLSFTSAGIVGAIAYIILMKLFPENPVLSSGAWGDDRGGLDETSSA